MDVVTHNAHANTCTTANRIVCEHKCFEVPSSCCMCLCIHTLWACACVCVWSGALWLVAPEGCAVLNRWAVAGWSSSLQELIHSDRCVCVCVSMCACRYVVMLAGGDMLYFCTNLIWQANVCLSVCVQKYTYLAECSYTAWCFAPSRPLCAW